MTRSSRTLRRTKRNRALITRRDVFPGLVGATTLAFIGPLLSARWSNHALTGTTEPATSAVTPAVGTAPSPTAAPSLPPAATLTALPTVSRTRKLKMRVALATEEAGHFIAFEKGFFKDVGLDVELVTTQGTPGEVIPLVAVGQLDLFSGAIQAALVNARTQGDGVTVVAGEGELRRGNLLHAYMVTTSLYDRRFIRFQTTVDECSRY